MKVGQLVGNIFNPWLGKSVLLFGISMYLLSGCKKSGDETNSVDCNGSMKSFAADVKPIMQASCAFDSDCHGAGSSSGPGSLLTYSEMFNARSIIRSTVLSGEMPKDARLTAADKQAIICWLDNGAPDN